MSARRSWPYTHTVEGEIDGIPFCNYYKRLDQALACAQRYAATVFDLVTLAAVKWDRLGRCWNPVGPGRFDFHQTKETGT